MRFIHCADLHLDSKMSANLDKVKAKERKSEILLTFTGMVNYATQNEIDGILIAGDLFDTKNISATTRNVVLSNIKNNPHIDFYYLKGNHDNDNFLAGLEEFPKNLKMFQSKWTTYEVGNVVISGIELSSENVRVADISLVLDSRKVNIVMMHGQEAESSSKDKAEIINLKAFRNKGIDYLALGHIHTHKLERLDARGMYCYPGCLEGRGFDECGEHGFVVVDIDEATKKLECEFIPFARRKLYTVNVDVTGCGSTSEMIDRVTVALREKQCETDSLVKIILGGSLDVECEKDTGYIVEQFKSQFYFVKLYDETTLRIDIEDYMLDHSLKGEYVRLIMNDDTISEDDKPVIIRYGLCAIAGEEVQ